MKFFISIILTLLFSLTSLHAQSEDRWEELADRLAAKAERIATQAERNAEKWEFAAERIGERFERKWDRDMKIGLERFPKKVIISCPDAVFLGIESIDISKEKARKLGFENSYGSYVSKVMENTVAQKGGLKPFDYIYGVNDQRTSNNQGLTDIMEDFKPGDEVTLHYIRKGKAQSVKVVLESHEDFDFEDSGEAEKAFLGVSPGENEDNEDMDGVSIEIVENSTAAEMGLKNGDVITAINGYPVLDWEDVTTAIENMKPGEQVEVFYKRDGKEMNDRQALKSYDEVYPEEDNGNWEEERNEENENYFEEEEMDGDGAFLGIYSEQLSENKARKLGIDNPYGSFVTGVLKNTAAEKAGIQPFDYLYGIDEYRVGENQSLSGILRRFKPGDNATVHFIRKSKKSSARVTFGKHEDAERTTRNSCEDPFLGVIESDNRSDGDTEGVMVNPVKNTTASDLGLQDGDVILYINGFKMLDWNDLTMAIDMLKPGETIAVEYQRNGKNMKASTPVKSYAETKNCKDCDCGKTEDITIRIDKPNFNFNYNFDSNKGSSSGNPRIDVSKAKVSVEDVSSSELGSLKNKGDGTAAGSLTVENLSLSPNSSKGTYKLEFRLPSTGNTAVRVFNASGRSIYEYELGKFSGNFSDDVDISQNGQGSYFLQVTQDSKVFNKKIVLQGN